MVRRSESFYFALTVDLLANLYFSPFGSTKKRFTAYQVGTLPLFYPLSLPLSPVLAPFWRCGFPAFKTPINLPRLAKTGSGQTHTKSLRETQKGRRVCFFVPAPRADPSLWPLVLPRVVFG